MFLKTIKSYPFLVWAASIALAPVAIMIEKYRRIKAINALFFAMGRTTFYSKYLSLAVYYSVALILSGVFFKIKGKT
jgi:hypothetical protein